MDAIQMPAGYHVYRLADIEAELGEDGFAAFSHWLDNQHGPIDNDGELLVFKYDYVRWQGHTETAAAGNLL